MCANNHRYRVVLAGVALGLGLLVPCRLAAAPAVEAGSFLRRPAHSLGEFLRRVQQDPVLQKRYGRHLRVPWQRIPKYLAERLRAERLAKTDHYTVYNVTSEGRIYPTKQRLRKGTPIYRLGTTEVFFSVNGDPARPFFTPTAPSKAPTGPPPKPVEHLEMIHVPSE
jgi:hypothetical protein